MKNDGKESLGLRLSQILLLLHQNAKLSRLALAESFGVSERTIYRDLNRLGDAVELNADGTYQLRPALKNEIHIQDLKAFARVVGVYDLFPIFNQHFIQRVLDDSSQISVIPHNYESGIQDRFALLEQALKHHHRCHFNYKDKMRLVDPYHLMARNGIWYLLAEESGKMKTFSLSRIEGLVLSKQTFECDPTKLNQFKNQQDIWFDDTEITVKLKIDAKVAYYFERRALLPKQEIIERKDNGDLIVVSTVQHFEQIRPLVQYWIPSVEVIEPVELREKIVSVMKQYLEFR